MVIINIKSCTTSRFPTGSSRHLGGLVGKSQLSFGFLLASLGLILEQFAEGKSHVGAQSDCHPAGLLRQRGPHPAVVGLSGEILHFSTSAGVSHHDPLVSVYITTWNRTIVNGDISTLNVHVQSLCGCLPEGKNMLKSLKFEANIRNLDQKHM